jgi:hypothetical protein
MSNFTRFMKQNKTARANTTFPATKSLTDEKGGVLNWEIKPVTTKQDEAIRDSCTSGAGGKERLDISKYLGKLAAAAVLYPDLYDAELQDSYGVKTPEDLLKEMLDTPSEYNDFVVFVQKYNGFDVTINEKIEEVKNA